MPELSTFMSYWKGEINFKNSISRIFNNKKTAKFYSRKGEDPLRNRNCSLGEI